MALDIIYCNLNLTPLSVTYHKRESRENRPNGSLLHNSSFSRLGEVETSHSWCVVWLAETNLDSCKFVVSRVEVDHGWVKYCDTSQQALMSSVSQPYCSPRDSLKVGA